MGDVHGTWRPHHNLCNVDVDGLAYRVYHGVRHVDGVAEHRFEVVRQCGQYVGGQYLAGGKGNIQSRCADELFCECRWKIAGKVGRRRARQYISDANVVVFQFVSETG